MGIQFPTYGIMDFLRFGFKWFKPTKRDICSENVVELMAAHGFSNSYQEPYNTAPWHLLEWAEKNPSSCAVSTIWKGKDFVS